jgi:enterochelin esterase family protein
MTARIRAWAVLAAALAMGLAAPLRAEPPAALAGIDTPAEADAFWREQAGRLPLIEAVPGKPDRMRVTFLWRQAGDAPVALSAGFLLDEGRDTAPLERLAGTDIHYLVRELPADARFSYYFVVAGGAAPRPDAVWHDDGKVGPRDYLADPLATRSFDEQGEDGRLRRLSWLSGPAAPDQRRLFAGEPGGRWIDYRIDSRALRETRDISVYVPRGVESAAAPGLLLIFDREIYRIAGRLPSMLDALVAEGRIRPMIAVLVSPMGDERRGRDLPPNAPFQAFIADELIPYVRMRHRLSRRAADAIVAGSSYGGLAALYTALEHPEIFGNAISQSASLWWYPACCGPEKAQEQTDLPVNAGPDADMGWLIERYATRPRAPVRIDMNVGRWEGALMLIPNRMMRHVLRARGYDVHYAEYDGGHDIIQWRATLPEALERLVAPDAVPAALIPKRKE